MPWGTSGRGSLLVSSLISTGTCHHTHIHYLSRDCKVDTLPCQEIAKYTQYLLRDGKVYTLPAKELQGTHTTCQGILRVDNS